MKAVSLYLGASGGEESHGSIDFRRFVCARVVDGLELVRVRVSCLLAVEMI
jgi:hypothetical protein